MVPIHDLSIDLASMTARARSEAEFGALFRDWFAGQESGLLRPLIEDSKRWGMAWKAPRLEHARETVERLSGLEHLPRARRIVARFEEVVGRRLDCDIVLLAGLRRPEGYSRFDRGRNTVFIGLDNPDNMAHPDQFEVILAHELLHTVRDPTPEVLADYGGWREMTHDDFVARYSFQEHLVSESLATSLSWVAYPGAEEHQYVYVPRDRHPWCIANRALIARRILEAIERKEHYHTFYDEDVVAPGSPMCCDYYFGFHLGRFALEHQPPHELVVLPATRFLDRYLRPFLDRFLKEAASVGFGRELAERATADPASVRRAQEDLQRKIAEDGATYAGEAYPVLATPLVLGRETAEMLRSSSEGLLGAIEKVVDLYREDPEVRAVFAFPPHLDEAIRVETGYRPHVPIARFDSYVEGVGVRYLELNTNGTTGIVLADQLARRAAEAPEVARAIERWGLEAEPMVPRLLEAIAEAWRQARGEGPERPRFVAILDFAGLATSAELFQLAARLEAEGQPARVVAPEELAYDGRTLSVAGRPIDLVYRRLTTNDVLERAARLAPFLAACRDRRVVAVGSFPADVAHSKKVFAILTHERWRDAFTPEERTLIDSHVPWTRVLAPGTTIHEGERTDLLELARSRRESFVLKPATRHEGHGVLLGVETPQERWLEEIERRLGHDHIIQEYVPPPVHQVVVPRGEGVATEARNLHVGEYMFGGRLAGYLVRISTELVLSFSSNELAIPCYVER